MKKTETVEAWMDGDMNEVSEEEASVHMVAEYDDEGNLLSEYMEVVDDKLPKISGETDEKAVGVDDQHTLRVSAYSPPQTRGDPLFKQLFLEQPSVEEKAEVTVLPDGSAFFVAEVPSKEESETEEVSEEKAAPTVDDEERGLRRRYLVEKLELVKDVRKRIRGDGDG